MTTQRYIILKKSDGSLERRYRVIHGSLVPHLTKLQKLRRTATGRLDVTEGAHVKSWEMTVRIRNVPTTTDPDGAAYGVLADLKELFALKNARATPSNRLILVDHLGVSHNVYMVGEFSEQNLTPLLDGANTVFHLPIFLEGA